MSVSRTPQGPLAWQGQARESESEAARWDLGKNARPGQAWARTRTRGSGRGPAPPCCHPGAPGPARAHGGFRGLRPGPAGRTHPSLEPRTKRDGAGTGAPGRRRAGAWPPRWGPRPGEVAPAAGTSRHSRQGQGQGPRRGAPAVGPGRSRCAAAAPGAARGSSGWS